MCTRADHSRQRLSFHIFGNVHGTHCAVAVSWTNKLDAASGAVPGDLFGTKNEVNVRAAKLQRNKQRDASLSLSCFILQTG